MNMEFPELIDQSFYWKNIAFYKDYWQIKIRIIKNFSNII